MKQFYFNDIILPTSCTLWSLCGYGNLLNGYEDDWDEFVGYKQIWHLFCRIDHVDVVESEDADTFLICVLQLLLTHLEFKTKVIDNIEKHAPQDVRSRELYMEIKNGLEVMADVVKKDGFAFWTTGEESAHLELRHFVTAARGKSTDLEYRIAPHIKQRKLEAQNRINRQLERLAEIV